MLEPVVPAAFQPHLVLVALLLAFVHLGLHLELLLELLVVGLEVVLFLLVFLFYFHQDFLLYYHLVRISFV